MAEEYPKAVYREDGVTFAVVHSFEEETNQREEWGLAPAPKIELISDETANDSAEAEEIADLKAQIEQLKIEKAEAAAAAEAKQAEEDAKIKAQADADALAKQAEDDAAAAAEKATAK